MEQIHVTISTLGIKEDLNFLINIELNGYKKTYGKLFLYLIGITVIIIGVALLPDLDILVNFKAVTLVIIGLLWIIAIVLIGFFLTIRWKRIKWRDKKIDLLVKSPIKYYLQYDDEKITIITDNYKVDYKWNYFSYYTETNNRIFIFNNTNIYEAQSFSSSEIGEENLQELKKITRQKLKPLNKK